MCSVHCSVHYLVQCIVYSALYTVQCIVYSAQKISLSRQDDAQRYAEGNAFPASFAQQMNPSKESKVSFGLWIELYN